MYRSLTDFVNALDQAGELQRISTKVSPFLEITQITDRVSKSPAPRASKSAMQFDPLHGHLGGKALLFENVEGSSIPLLINAFGSYHRMEMALDCTSGGFEALAEKVGKLVKPEPPTGLMSKLKKIPELAKIASYSPKVIPTGICQQVVNTGENVDLFELPTIKCWPLDGDPSAFGAEESLQEPGKGRYITFGGVHTIHPDDAGKPANESRTSRNVGMYRAQVLDQRRAAMHWHIHHDGARHWRAWKQCGKPMPAAIALGGESVLPYSATAPLPPGISELLLAGFLNDGGIEMVKCQTIDLHVPANSEIVIEGLVSTECGSIGYDPRKYDAHNTSISLGPGAHYEGPFGDHTGFYSLPDRYPLFEVTAITHRTNPIYPTTIVGLPPQEDYYMGKATERIFLPLLKTLIPDIIDYDLPMFGAFHNCVFVKIRKEYPLQARRVMHAIWGAGQMAWTKSIIVVDEHVNVHDHEEVLFYWCANCDPKRDIELVNGPLDILDHAAPQLGAGGKIGYDATAKIPGEEVNGQNIREWPTLIQMDKDTKQLVEKRWKEYGFTN